MHKGCVLQRISLVVLGMRRIMVWLLDSKHQTYIFKHTVNGKGPIHLWSLVNLTFWHRVPYSPDKHQIVDKLGINCSPSSLVVLNSLVPNCAPWLITSMSIPYCVSDWDIKPLALMFCKSPLTVFFYHKSSVFRYWWSFSLSFTFFKQSFLLCLNNASLFDYFVLKHIRSIFNDRKVRCSGCCIGSFCMK